MRLVRVKAPEGGGEEVAQVAFAAGISQVTTHQQQVRRANGERETKDVIDVETATPKAKVYLDALMAAPFFDNEKYSIAVRQPRSVVARERPPELTWPLVEPTIDIFEELWQFSLVTYGFVGRVLIAAMLLAYGMIQHQLLVMLGGLLFLPLLPLLLAMGFGSWTGQWRLALQGLFAFLVAIALLISGGVVVALLTSPPLQYNQHNPLVVSFLISLGVGIAAGLATADDVGRREMIGLAATAQMAILPVWFGIGFVFGFPPLDTTSPAQRALTFGVNAVTIVVAALCTYALLGMRGDSLRGFT
ncbi:MAG TPA: hypothetical protein VER76_01995, partial [Pyrinomonadaceae bacterium]|nr:hypothetical protein [Pyrinomonadaceae bacterium]